LLSDLILAKRKNHVALFEKPESFADNLACGVVATGFHLALDELFEFWSKVDVKTNINLE
jgi:hypothetical protein